jgi:hypothetical protein
MKKIVTYNRHLVKNEGVIPIKNRRKNEILKIVAYNYWKLLFLVKNIRDFTFRDACFCRGVLY